jgi:hypothetical protein
VERVVLNALARNAALAAGYLRVPRIIGHRLQEKPIHRGEQKTVFANSRKEKRELWMILLHACEESCWNFFC